MMQWLQSSKKLENILEDKNRTKEMLEILVDVILILIFDFLLFFLLSDFIFPYFGLDFVGIKTASYFSLFIVRWGPAWGWGGVKRGASRSLKKVRADPCMQRGGWGGGISWELKSEDWERRIPRSPVDLEWVAREDIFFPPWMKWRFRWAVRIERGYPPTRGQRPWK